MAALFVIVLFVVGLFVVVLQLPIQTQPLTRIKTGDGQLPFTPASQTLVELRFGNA